MKKIHFQFLILFFSLSLQAQTKLDQFVSADMPGDHKIKLDTIINGFHLNAVFSTINNEHYQLLKSNIGDPKSGTKQLNTDKKLLRQEYTKFIQGFTKSMEANGFSLSSLTEFKIDKYIYYKGIFNNVKEANKKVVEVNFLILNSDGYAFLYMNTVDFNETNKNNFLDSIKIDPTFNPTQGTYF